MEGKTRNRRWLLASAAAAAAVAGATAVTKQDAEASSGFMWYGENNDADTSPTTLYSTVASTGTVFKVKNRSTGTAIYGLADSWSSSARGVLGEAAGGRGVYGKTETGDGVYGYAGDTGDGVTGWAAGTGRGVFGHAGGVGGIGVHAEGTGSATALTVDGPAQFNGTAAFSGGMSGSGSGLTSLNASNLASGTVNDLRLSSNIPRKNQDNIFTGSVTASSFSGALNASNLTGTISDARLSSSVPLKNAGSNTFTGSILASSFSGAVNASNLTGTISDARLSSNVPLKNAGSNTFTGPVTASSFSGALDASNLTGTINDARLSSNVPLKDASSNTFTGPVTASSFSGAGGSLTGLDASNLASGTVADGRLSANVPLKDATSNVFTGAIEAASFAGDGDGLANLDASALTSGALPDARLSANIPRKNAETNVFTGTVQADKFVGDGSGLTNLPLPTASNTDASAITSGTLSDARLSPNVALKNSSGTSAFAGAVSAKSFTGPSGLPRFPTAGAATVRKGGSRVRVRNAAVSASAIVLAVLQSDPGRAVAIRHVVKGAGFFDVFLTGAVAAKTTVGYMLVGKP